MFRRVIIYNSPGFWHLPVAHQPMSPSTRKDFCRAIGIHEAPSYLSQAEFEAKMKALADALLAVPIVQQNFLKFDIVWTFSWYSLHLIQYRYFKTMSWMGL